MTCWETSAARSSAAALVAANRLAVRGRTRVTALIARFAGLAGLVGLVGLAVLAGLGLGACGRSKAPPPSPVARRGVVAPPLANPAGYCRDSCPRKIRCRIGRVAPRIFEQEVSRCRLDCLRWIRDHADEAVAAAPCYGKTECSVLRACLAEVHRIVSDRKIPAKVKECTELCATLGTCQGDATDCTLRCRTGDVPIYRALLRCSGKRCPQVRTCVESTLAKR